MASSNAYSAFINHIQPKFKRSQKVWYYPLGKDHRDRQGNIYRRLVKIAEVKRIGDSWLYRLDDSALFPTFHYDTVLEASTP